MLKVIFDGLFALNAYKEAVLVFLISITGLGLYVLRYLGDSTEDTLPKYVMGLCLGSAVLSIFAYAIMLTGHFVPLVMRAGSLAILFFSVIALLHQSWFSKADFSYVFFITFCSVFLLLLTLRLSFLQHIILPPYSDSPIHYQIVQGFIHPESSGSLRLSLGNIAENYYHFGFHSLAAWLALVSGISIEDAILLLGQLILVILPVSIFVLSYALTANLSAALYAGLLSAIGWPMPAFAVNWGKYPALAAIAIAPAVVTSVIFYAKNNSSIKTYFWKLLLLGSICLLHTRILVCLALLIPSLYIAKKINFEEKITAWRAVRFSLLCSISLIPLYTIITDFYQGILVWIALLLLMPFAFYAYPRLFIGAFLYLIGSWMVLKIPTLLPFRIPMLFDGQFVGMFLYIPFSILGGAGFAGALKVAQFPIVFFRQVAIALPVALVLVNAFLHYSVYPDSCCNYFDSDDQNAFAWIKQYSLPNSLFLISAFEDSGKNIGTDAGIWIYPLTGRSVNKLSYTFNWDSQNEIEGICQSGAKTIYIYVGNDQNSFKIRPSGSNLIRNEFQSGAIIIYQLVGCSP